LPAIGTAFSGAGALVARGDPSGLPELGVVAVESGDEAYLAWLAAEASGETG